VGSEMCIRDRAKRVIIPFFALSLKTVSAFIIGSVPAMLILLMAVWSS